MKRFLIECGLPLSVPIAGTVLMIIMAICWRRPANASHWWSFGPLSTGFFLSAGTFVVSCVMAAWIWNERSAGWFAGLLAAFGAVPFAIWLCMW